MLKNKFNENKNIYNSILNRHNCSVNLKDQNIIFNNEKVGLLRFFYLLSPLILSLSSLFLNKFFPFGFFICIIAITIGYFNIKNIFIKDRENNTLTHEDYKDLATVFSKEEIKNLSSYYEEIFYSDENNKEEIYKFNLMDLFTPIENTLSIEESKNINQQKFSQYIDAVYEENKKISNNKDKI